ncbi:uncharacterized protein [Tenebrio molitor]|uniref:uncharacterized protein isoform X2 n=1 Tax=Tenebrio molitor TaxID=7067 RepID=UPI0036248844
MHNFETKTSSHKNKQDQPPTLDRSLLKFTGGGSGGNYAPTPVSPRAGTPRPPEPPVPAVQPQSQSASTSHQPFIFSNPPSVLNRQLSQYLQSISSQRTPSSAPMDLGASPSRNVVSRPSTSAMSDTEQDPEPPVKRQALMQYPEPGPSNAPSGIVSIPPGML